MCFDPLSLALTAAGSIASGAGTKMQNDANNKAARINFQAERAADAQNREIDARNNVRINDDIAKAEQIQFQALQQDAEDARVRNQVLAEFTARQRQVADRNAAAIATGAVAQGADSTKQVQAGAATARTDFAKNAIDGAAPVDPNFMGSTPSFIQGELAKAIAAGRATATDRAGASAAVSAYGDAGTRQMLGLADIVGGIGLNNNFAKGDLSLLPAEQELRGSLVRTPIYAPPPTLLEGRVSRPNQQPAKTSEAGALLKGIGSLAGSVGGSKSPVWSADGKSVTGYEPTAQSWFNSAKSTFGF
jgi:hypothetical protein